jgi:hypothetical protein
MFLIDTMVLSESFKARPHPDVISWMTSVPERPIFISGVAVGEISRGVRKLERQDTNRAAGYRDWLETILEDYDGRIPPIAIGTMRMWGPLTYDLRHTNPDLLIAATALEHDLTLVTRNIRHFEPTGVKLFNPYEQTA